METTPDLPIEHRDPRTLTPHPDNYRGHPDAQVEAIARNISDLGMYRPVVVTTEGVVLAGHGVTLAAAKLDLETIPVYVFEGTEAAAKRLMVADNELSRGAEDSEETLAALLGEIAESYGDLRGTGWSEDALAELVAEIEEGGYTPNITPEVKLIEYTDDEIEHAADGLKEKMRDGQQLKEVVCPYCSKEFYLDE